ncbi:MAG: AI-2E family transporter [Eubacteriales bacterium]
MENHTFRKPVFLITYTALLALAVLNIQLIWAYCSQVLEVMMPFFAGFAIAFVLSQLCNFFLKWIGKALPNSKYGLQNGLAVTLSYVSVFFFLFTLVSIVIPKLVENVNVFVESLKVYTANLQEWLNGLTANTDSELLSELSVDLSGLFDYLSQYLEKILSEALNAASFAATQVMAATGTMIATLVNLVIALVFSIYMLADRKNLCAQCKRLLFAYVPQKQAEKIHFVTCLSGKTFSKFVAGQVIEACILGTLCAIGMLFIQADYALLIGIIVGVTALVPVVGGYIGGGFSFVLLFMVGPMEAVIFLVFLLILQQLEGNLIYPKVVGSSLGLPGLWVVFAVIIGGGLYGIMGSLLSVPVVSVVYALLKMDVAKREELQTT